jgi:hypothetical protein
MASFMPRNVLARMSGAAPGDLVPVMREAFSTSRMLTFPPPWPDTPPAASVRDFFSAALKKRRPCGEYVDAQTEHPPPDNYDSWADWLQDYRFELDAMTGPHQAAYLDEKLAGAFGKVIPPSELIRLTLLKQTRKIAEETIEADVLARARPEIARRLDAVMLTAEADVPLGAKLKASVADQLAEDPTLLWRFVVEHMARDYSHERAA